MNPRNYQFALLAILLLNAPAYSQEKADFLPTGVKTSWTRAGGQLGVMFIDADDMVAFSFTSPSTAAVPSFSFRKVIGDEIQQLPRVKGPFGLSLEDAIVDVKTVEKLLGQFDQIVALDLTGTPCEDADLETFFKHGEKLRWLDLSGTKITDRCLGQLVKCKNLEWIGLAKTAISDEGIRTLSQHTRLTGIFAPMTRLSDKVVDHLMKMKQLRSINLSWTSVTDSGLKQLASLEKLEWLAVAKNSITDAGLTSISKNTSIQYLNLNFNSISDLSMKHLATMKQLKILMLDSQKNITDNGISLLKRHPNLEKLGLSGTRITDEVMPVIASIPKLSSLTVGWTSISDRGVAPLTNIPHLEKLWLNSTMIGDDSLAHLSKIQTLRELNLTETQITEKGVAQLSKLSLTQLSIPIEIETKIGLENYLKCFKNPSSLDLRGWKISDADAKIVLGLGSIKSLRVEGNDISETILQQLLGLPQLRELRLGKTNLPPRKIEDFSKSYPQIRIVYLKND